MEAAAGSHSAAAIDGHPSPSLEAADDRQPDGCGPFNPSPEAPAPCVASAFQRWKYRRAFNFWDEKGKNITVQCCLCKPKVKLLSTARSSTSNLKKHLQRAHPEFFEDTPCPGQVPLKHSATWDHNTEPEVFESQIIPFKKIVLYPPIESKPMLVKPVPPNRCPLPLSPAQELLNRLVVDFVVQDVQRFSLVEQPSFIALIKGLSPSCELMCRQALADQVEGTFERMMADVRARLQDIPTVCTTADIWSWHGRSFLGMTVHWIDSSSLKRQSAALACCRLGSKIPYSQIASKICEVHASFGLQGKVRCIVTDNGYSFMKSYHSFPFLTEGLGDINMVKQEGKEGMYVLDELKQEDADDLPVFLDVDKLLTEKLDFNDAYILLPPHHRCAAHDLNLVASKDSYDVLNNGPPALKKLFQSTAAKCISLWKRSNQSVLAPEAGAEDDGVSSWNSFYQVCGRMRGVPEGILHDICDHLNLERFRISEFTFLDEYCRIMEPVASALDILQAESKCLIGFLLPTIAALRKKLENLRMLLTITEPLVDGLLEALHRRFSSCFSNRHLVIASASIPQFRLRWMEDNTAEQAVSFLREEVASIKPFEVHQPVPQVVEIDDDEDFFQFSSSRPALCEEEVLQFLTDGDKSLSCLAKYPLVKQVFITHNTPVPSSALVEHLFSLGGTVLTPSKQRLSDHSFEKLVLLRFNSGATWAQGQGTIGTNLVRLRP